MLTAFVTAVSHIRRAAHQQMYYQTKKLLDMSCKYLTTVRVIAYKVIFKWSFKHPHNGFGCLLADHVTPPE